MSKNIIILSNISVWKPLTLITVITWKFWIIFCVEPMLNKTIKPLVLHWNLLGSLILAREIHKCQFPYELCCGKNVGTRIVFNITGTSVLGFLFPHFCVFSPRPRLSLQVGKMDESQVTSSWSANRCTPLTWMISVWFVCYFLCLSPTFYALY